MLGSTNIVSFSNEKLAWFVLNSENLMQQFDSEKFVKLAWLVLKRGDLRLRNKSKVGMTIACKLFASGMIIAATK